MGLLGAGGILGIFSLFCRAIGEHFETNRVKQIIAAKKLELSFQRIIDVGFEFVIFEGSGWCIYRIKDYYQLCKVLNILGLENNYTEETMPEFWLEAKGDMSLLQYRNADIAKIEKVDWDSFEKAVNAL